jgi:hypothetical protein
MIILNKISQKDNYYETTSQLSYYNYETASNTQTDPSLLRNILKIGRDDYVSRVTALNPSTPSDILVEILERGKEDGVSWNASGRYNVPPKVLAEQLLKRPDDGVSRGIAQNPYTPPEALAERLRRGDNDWTSQYIAKNHNTPIDALKEAAKRIDITKDVSMLAAITLRDLRKIKPKKFKSKTEEQALEEQKELAILRELMAGNNWYKKLSRLRVPDFSNNKNWEYMAHGNGYWTFKDPSYIIDASDGMVYRVEKDKKVIYKAQSYDEAIEWLDNNYNKSHKEVKEEPFEDIINYLGYTDNPKEAGYITQDGQLIDLSGKNGGGMYGKRSLDHREMGGTKGMQEFVALGNIRIGLTGDSFFVDMKQKPTIEQKRIIRRIIENMSGGRVYLELQNGLGEYNKGSHIYFNSENTYSKEYSSFEIEDMFEDIDNFYRGIQKSELAKYLSNINWYKKATLTDNEFNEITMPKWISVDSSFISDIAYYEPLKILEVRFKNGQIYGFGDVPVKAYEDFMEAKSKGEFFNRIIKQRYGKRK